VANVSSGEEDVPFGPYRLERRLAVGGMSEVFLAHPREGTLPASRVVLKRLLPEIVEDEDVRRAFLLEAKLHAAARHPNVVEFFECGSYAGEPYIAMEYVAGLDLFRLLRRLEMDRRLTGPDVACFIASELCAALDFVHSLRNDRGHPLGVVHRDVSPSNILLSSRGQVKLSDFGIARLARPSGEMASFALKGKHQYLAPEQVAGEAFDHRADIFALAVVLSEMLIGAQLFRGAGQLAVLLAIRDVRIEPLREIAHRLPRGLFQVLERALAKDPLARYATSAELAAALAPFVPGDRAAIQDRARLARWLRLRHRLRGPQARGSGARGPRDLAQPEPDTLRGAARAGWPRRARRRVRRSSAAPPRRRARAELSIAAVARQAAHGAGGDLELPDAHAGR
jgi:eukaryotic-like serine/threonine-protein kinase